MNDIRIMEQQTADRLAKLHNTDVQTNDGYSELPTITPRFTSSPKIKGRTVSNAQHHIIQSMHGLSLTHTNESTSNMNSPPSKTIHNQQYTPTQSKLNL